MKHFLVKQINRVDFKTALELFMLLSLLVVWIVWPLRGTIAARNIALVLGSISSIAWLSIERPKFVMMDLLPIGFLLCVPVWLLSLYIFNPIASYLQWDDLRGTWLRVVIGIIFATGLAALINKNEKYSTFFICVISIWPVVYFLSYVANIYQNDIWISRNFNGMFKSKIAIVYFLMWPILFITSYFHLDLARSNKKNLLINRTLFFVLFLSVLGYLIINALNGFLLLFFIGIIFIIVYIRFARISSAINYKKIILFGLLSALFLVNIFYLDTVYSGKKLQYLFHDLYFIVALDDSGAWKWIGGQPPYPINPLTAQLVSGSTYERFAWFLEGVKLLVANPEGTGFTGQAFHYLMDKTYHGSEATKTHSGWLDFALGVGIPGLLCIWAALFLMLKRACQFIINSRIYDWKPFLVFWVVCGTWFLWIFGELSDREYIENYFFCIAFVSLLTVNQNIFYRVDNQH